MIKVSVRPENPNANLKTYYETYRSFEWPEIERDLFGGVTNEINITTQAIDRWADDPATSEKDAFIFCKQGNERRVTYGELKRKSSRWANLLTKYNYKPGDRVFIFLPSCPEIYFAMAACARIGIIFSVLFHTLSTEELEWRCLNGDPRGILTHPDLMDRFTPDSFQNVKHVFLTTPHKPGIGPSETILDAVSEHMPDECPPRIFSRETPLYLVYTSGSTGPPKGVVHAHEDMIGHYVTAKYCLELDSNSTIWTDAEPAWITGLVYGSFAPWLCGATSVIQGDTFSPKTWYRTLEKYQVTTWYSTPLIFRKLMLSGEIPVGNDLSNLIHIASVGETLVPELFYWIKEHLNHSPHDTWWMSETGMICISNFPSLPIKPGSMGRPVPGIEAAVLDPKGEPLSILTLGELALKPSWPALMKTIWRDERRYEQYFSEGWFLTGDMVIKDEDGYFYHQGRNDDLIKSGSCQVGPYEFEQILCLHRAVNEAAVISRKQEGELPAIKAFLKLDRAYAPSDDLANELKLFLKTSLNYEVQFDEISFIPELPKTRSGKVLRRVLRVWELGLPSGNPSNLNDK